MSRKTKMCQGKDAFERMNFLYQAGILMSGKNPTLSCYYGNLCKSIAKKSLTKMEPDIKRTICKLCGQILVPGISSDITLDETTNATVKIKCKKCLKVKVLTINSNYTLWLDNPESIKEVIHFNHDKNNDNNNSNDDKSQSKEKKVLID